MARHVNSNRIGGQTTTNDNEKAAIHFRRKYRLAMQDILN